MSEQLMTYFSWIVMAATVALSFIVVVAKWPIFGAISLIGSLLTAAILFVMLSAPFTAVTQILVYAGGILVLFIYILMLLGVKRSQWSRGQKFALFGLFFGSLIFTCVPLLAVLQPNVAASGFAAVADDFGSIEKFGKSLLAGYAYPFELMSVLLVAVIAGVVYLTRRDE